jgi:protein-S-isoprenylcysteine O-methyltransferase Ste14
VSAVGERTPLAPPVVVPKPGIRWTPLLFAAPLTTVWLLFGIANLEKSIVERSPVGLGATLLELVVAALFLLRRQPLVVSRSPLAWLAAGIGTFGMLGARPSYAPVLGLGPLFFGLQLLGASLAAISLGALGRSFGVVAANRGIRTHGMYRVVRHPLYASYVVTELGYVLENPSVANAFLLLIVMSFQVVRIRAEERCLLGDPEYVAYRERVRWRVLPFVW